MNTSVARRAVLASLGLLGLACREPAPAPAPATSTSSASAQDLSRVTLRAADQVGLTRGQLSLVGALDTPYRIEWSSFPAGPPLLEAIGADAADFGAVGDSPPILAQAAGVPIRVVAALRNSPQYEVLLIPQHSPLKDLRDLRGKRVAVAKGSGAHHLLLAALRSVGLKTADIQPVYLTPHDAQPAFQHGNVDAWAVWDPYAANQLRQGARKLADGTGLIPGYNFQVTSEKALADPVKARVLRDYLQRLQRAQAYANDHREAWAARYAELSKLPIEVARDMFEHHAPVYVPIDAEVKRAQQALADLFLEEGLIPKRLVVSEVFDDRFNATLANR